MCYPQAIHFLILRFCDYRNGYFRFPIRHVKNPTFRKVWYIFQEHGVESAPVKRNAFINNIEQLAQNIIMDFNRGMLVFI